MLGDYYVQLYTHRRILIYTRHVRPGGAGDLDSGSCGFSQEEWRSSNQFVRNHRPATRSRGQ